MHRQAQADAHQVVDDRVELGVDGEVGARDARAEVDRQPGRQDRGVALVVDRPVADQHAAEADVEQQLPVLERQLDVVGAGRELGEEPAVVAVLQRAARVAVGDDEGEELAVDRAQAVEQLRAHHAQDVFDQARVMGVVGLVLQPLAESVAVRGPDLVAEHRGAHAADAVGELVERRAADDRQLDEVDAVGDAVQAREEALEAVQHVRRAVEERE